MSLENVYAVAAHYGARMLDGEYGGIGWAARLNAEILNMADVSLCVLAQLYGSFNDGMNELDLTVSDVYRLGFDIQSGYASEENYALLEIAWIDEISKRVADLI